MAIKRRHVKAIIQLRRAKEQDWIDYNPVLRVGEPALSTDVYKLKIGDGKRHWLEIPYLHEDEQGVSFVDGFDGVEGDSKTLYVDKESGSVYIYQDGEFVELESTSISELETRVSTNEEIISEHTTDISALSEKIEDLQDKTYVHNQSPAASVWTINHNLGKLPAITIVDSAGTVVVGDIVMSNEEVAVVSFQYPFSGKAICN